MFPNSSGLGQYVEAVLYAMAALAMVVVLCVSGGCVPSLMAAPPNDYKAQAAAVLATQSIGGGVVSPVAVPIKAPEPPRTPVGPVTSVSYKTAASGNCANGSCSLPSSSRAAARSNVQRTTVLNGPWRSSFGRRLRR